MEEQESMSPFWQPSRNSHHRRRRSITSSVSPSSLFFNSGFLIIILVLTALVFIFIITPSFHSLKTQIFKPNLVKKSWDSLNLVLVLFAILCAFLSRNSSNDSVSGSFEDYKFENRVGGGDDIVKSNPETPQNRVNKLRSFSSYTDLRQEDPSWVSSDDPWRFYDDTHLYNYRSLSSLNPDHHLQWSSSPKKLEEETQDKTEEKQSGHVDTSTTFVIESQKEVVYTPPPPTSPPHKEEKTLEEPIAPPQPPPTKDVRRKVRRTHQDLGKEDEEVKRVLQATSQLPPPSPPHTEDKILEEPIAQPQPQPTNAVRRKVRRAHLDLGKKEDEEVKKMFPSTSLIPPSPRPPPSPRLSPPVEVEEEGRSIMSERKRSGSGSATKDFLASLRRNKKKKKQRQKSVENLDSFFNYESYYNLPSPHQPPPPPPLVPPPPPPPPAFFQSLFSPKKRKPKKIKSPPPPPPPPPPPSRTQLSTKSRFESRNYVSVTTQKPPLPITRNYNTTGNESPLNSVIPAPPPLPPFRMPSLKYEIHGDYVRLKSFKEEADESSDGGGGDSSGSPLFCPSPDVDTKADNFIARFRAGLQLEKINSVNERGKSNLGP